MEKNFIMYLRTTGNKQGLYVHFYFPSKYVDRNFYQI